MAKKETKGKAKQAKDEAAPEKSGGKLSRKDYEKEMRRLQTELCLVQDWVKATGQRIIIVFEGRDAAGKGGTIRAITERCSPRVFRVAALPAPSDREKSQMYLQRYMPHFPAAGEVVIFDRSYYNRAGVERVLGFSTQNQVREFLNLCPAFEKIMVDNGIRVIKYWLEVKESEQERRFEARIQRSPAAVEAEPDRPRITPALVRLFEGPRRDVRRHRHGLGALAYRALRFEEACAPQLHQPSAHPHSLQAGGEAQGQDAEALDEAGL